MDKETLVFFKPGINLMMFVRTIVVCNDMNVKPHRGRTVDLLQEFEIFLMAVPFFTFRQYLSGQHIKSGKKTTCSVANILPMWIWRHAMAASSASGNASLGQCDFRRRIRRF